MREADSPLYCVVLEYVLVQYLHLLADLWGAFTRNFFFVEIMIGNTRTCWCKAVLEYCTRNVEVFFLKRTTIAYHQNWALWLGFGYAIAGPFRKMLRHYKYSTRVLCIGYAGLLLDTIKLNWSWTRPSWFFLGCSVTDAELFIERIKVSRFVAGGMWNTSLSTNQHSSHNFSQ